MFHCRLRKSYKGLTFHLHEDNPKVKEMTEEPVRNWKTAYLKVNIDHGY